MKYIKNLEDKTQSVLSEDIASDAAEISGLDKDIVADAIKDLDFSSYLEFGNAVSVEDGETIRDILNISDIVPNDPMSEIDLGEATIGQYDAWALEDEQEEAIELINDATERVGEFVTADDVIEKLKTGYVGYNPSVIGRAIQIVKQESGLEEDVNQKLLRYYATKHPGPYDDELELDGEKDEDFGWEAHPDYDKARLAYFQKKFPAPYAHELEEDRYEDATDECIACYRIGQSTGVDAWGDTCVNCGGKGRVMKNGDYVDDDWEDKMYDLDQADLEEAENECPNKCNNGVFPAPEDGSREACYACDKFEKRYGIDKHGRKVNTNLEEAPNTSIKNYKRAGKNKQQYKWKITFNNGKSKTVWADSRYNATLGQISPEQHIVGIKSVKKIKIVESIDRKFYVSGMQNVRGRYRITSITRDERGVYDVKLGKNGVWYDPNNGRRLVFTDNQAKPMTAEWVYNAMNSVNEADNPSAPTAASPAQQAVTPPSAGSSINALAQPADTATEIDDQEVQQGRKEVDDLQIGDQIEVADIDGQPAAGRVRNLAGPGDTLVITGKGKEEHMIRKDSILSTPMIPVQEGAVKQFYWEEAESMPRDKFITKYGEDLGEFWDNVHDIYEAKVLCGLTEQYEAALTEGFQHSPIKVLRDVLRTQGIRVGRGYNDKNAGNRKIRVYTDNTLVNKPTVPTLEDLEAIVQAGMEKAGYEVIRVIASSGGHGNPTDRKGATNTRLPRAGFEAKVLANVTVWLEGNPVGSRYQTNLDEEGFGEETYEEMVEYWKTSLSQSIVRKGLFTQLYDAANRDIDELNAAIEDQANSIADSYHGTGEGIGSSDQNHFIAHIGSSLGVEDIFGWRSPKIASDVDMERDKATRSARYSKAVRAEGLGEEDSDLSTGNKGRSFRRPDEYEQNIASNFMRSAGYSAREIGVDNNTGNIAVRDTAASDRPLFLLDRSGKVINVRRVSDKQATTMNETKDMVVKYQGREIGTVWQEENGEWHGEHNGSGMSWATDNRKDMFSRIKDHEIETLNEGIGFHFYVEPQKVGALVMSSKGDIYDFYEDETEARRVAEQLNAQYGKVDEDLTRIRELAGIKETASGGATGAGAIASSPSAMNGVQKRNPSIYGQTKLKKKPTPKTRQTKENASAGIGRSKKT